MFVHRTSYGSGPVAGVVEVGSLTRGRRLRAVFALEGDLIGYARTGSSLVSDRSLLLDSGAVAVQKSGQ